jgi:hypothetical protein
VATAFSVGEGGQIMANQNRGGSPRATSPRRLLAAEKQRQALELKIGGATLEQIAAKVGYKDSSGAYRAIQAGLKATLQPPADELRRLQHQRLERLYAAAHKKALGGDAGGPPDFDAMDRAIKLAQRINALFGLETTKLKVGGDADAPPIQVAVDAKARHDVYSRLTTDELRALRDLRNRLAQAADGGSDGEAAATVEWNGTGPQPG